MLRQRRAVMRGRGVELAHVQGRVSGEHVRRHQFRRQAGCMRQGRECLLGPALRLQVAPEVEPRPRLQCIRGRGRPPSLERGVEVTAGGVRGAEVTQQHRIAGPHAEGLQQQHAGFGGALLAQAQQGEQPQRLGLRRMAAEHLRNRRLGRGQLPVADGACGGVQALDLDSGQSGEAVAGGHQ